VNLRILQVASGLPGWAGTEKHITDISPLLSRRGHEVTIACQPGSEIEARSASAGLSIVHLSMHRPHDWGQLPGLVKAMRGRYDVVHIHGYRDYLVPAAAARLARTPAVAMTRHLPHPFRSRLTAWTCSRALYDGIIAVSDFIAEVMIKSGVRRERVFVVKNGIELLPFQQNEECDVRQELGIPRTAFLAAAVGRLSPEKGFNVLVRAIALLRRKGVNAFCLIAGPGTGGERLEQLSEELQVRSAVRILGLRRDVPALFRAADVVVVPSTFPDPFPYAVLEGLASGRPVVASRTGGISEVVTVDTGFLTAPGDSEGIAGALAELAGSPSKRAAMGHAARCRANCFSLDACVGRIEHVYLALVNRDKPNR
jgi:glycosyltransferase involved in cell wall biosynthesis